MKSKMQVSNKGKARHAAQETFWGNARVYFEIGGGRRKGAGAQPNAATEKREGKKEKQNSPTRHIAMAQKVNFSIS